MSTFKSRGYVHHADSTVTCPGCGRRSSPQPTPPSPKACLRASSASASSPNSRSVRSRAARGASSAYPPGRSRGGAPTARLGTPLRHGRPPSKATAEGRPGCLLSTCGAVAALSSAGPSTPKPPMKYGGSGVPPRGFELRRAWLYQATFRSGKRNPCRWTPVDSAPLRRAFSPNFHSPVTAQPVALGKCVLASGRRATPASAVLAVVGASADGALADRPLRSSLTLGPGRLLSARRFHLGVGIGAGGGAALVLASPVWRRGRRSLGSSGTLAAASGVGQRQLGGR